MLALAMLGSEPDRKTASAAELLDADAVTTSCWNAPVACGATYVAVVPDAVRLPPENLPAGFRLPHPLCRVHVALWLTVMLRLSPKSSVGLDVGERN